MKQPSSNRKEQQQGANKSRIVVSVGLLAAIAIIAVVWVSQNNNTEAGAGVVFLTSAPEQSTDTPEQQSTNTPRPPTATPSALPPTIFYTPTGMPLPWTPTYTAVMFTPRPPTAMPSAIPPPNSGSYSGSINTDPTNSPQPLLPTVTVPTNTPSALDYLNEANAFATAGDFGSAMSNYAQAILADPDNPDLHYARGEAYMQQSFKRGAIRAFRDGIDAANKKLALRYDDWMAIYDTLGTPDSLITDENILLQLDLEYVNAHWKLGILYDDSHEIENALRYYSIYVELAGDNADESVIARITALQQSSN